MKVIKSIAVLSLSACLFACTSKPDLDGFRKVDISNNMLDTMPEGRLSNYKETIEKTYLLGCPVLSTAGSSSESSPAQLKEWKEALSMPDTIKPIYRERLWDFVFYPQITYEVESKYLGIYQRRKTVIKGIGLDMITGEEDQIETKVVFEYFIHYNILKQVSFSNITRI